MVTLLAPLECHPILRLSYVHDLVVRTGNIVGFYDVNSAAIVAAVEYSPYGRVLNSYTYSGVSLSSYPIGFSGEYTDWETALVYYGRRYYQPLQGRFINRDPSGPMGGPNLYESFLNNPSSVWDVVGDNPLSFMVAPGISLLKPISLPNDLSFLAGYEGSINGVSGEVLGTLSNDEGGIIMAGGYGTTSVGFENTYDVNVGWQTVPIAFKGNQYFGSWVTSNGWGMYGLIPGPFGSSIGASYQLGTFSKTVNPSASSTAGPTSAQGNEQPGGAPTAPKPNSAKGAPTGGVPSPSAGMTSAPNVSGLPTTSTLNPIGSAPVSDDDGDAENLQDVESQPPIVLPPFPVSASKVNSSNPAPNAAGNAAGGNTSGNGGTSGNEDLPSYSSSSSFDWDYDPSDMANWDPNIIVLPPSAIAGMGGGAPYFHPQAPN
jgi:RHS repeat-associated protein